jgi:hypothetical protein
LAVAAIAGEEKADDGLSRSPLKILVLAPNRDYSHFALNRRLARLLADRGHHVVCLSILYKLLC